MYAKIENDQVVEWPLYEGDLEKRFPDLSFPLDTHNLPVPEGYVRVKPRMIENYNINLEYVQTNPIYLNGEWVMNWEGKPLSEEQIQQRKSLLAESQIKKRNELLQKTDWTQVIDAPLTDAKKESYKLYRQKLRDISDQEGFPTSIDWPVEPF
jgi:hypothetical protein